MSEKVFKAESDEQILACWPVMHELRPHIPEDGFVDRVRRMQSQGFHLAGLRDSGEVVAVAGYRYIETLFGGRTLYVDDLVTAEASRSRGHGATLVAWLRDEARENACDMLHLDSGVQRGRAHAFYFAQGFQINSFHFALKP